MKRNTKLMIIVGILLIIVVGASFAYYVATVGINGEGANVGGTTETLIKVEYDAGTSNLVADNLYPGVAVSKDFSVIVTPGSVQNEAKYVIKFNISENTFTKCTYENYDEITNACEIGATELQAILKDGNGNVIATKDITGLIGKIELAGETKTVTEKTIYNYTLDILFVDTNKDQNHNANKKIEGEINVEFGEEINYLVEAQLLLEELPTFLNTDIKVDKIESLTTLDKIEIPEGTASFDVSEKQNKSIMAWYQDTDNNGLYEVYIGQVGGVVANPNSSWLFAYLISLNSIDLSHFNTSNVTNMEGMFYSMTNLTSLDVSKFNTSNVTSMYGMFWGICSVTSLDLSSFDTSKVTNMSHMFYEAQSLINLDLSNFDTLKVTDMSEMFLGTSNLNALKLNKATFNSVTDSTNMFGASTVSSIEVKDSDAKDFINAMLTDVGNSATITIAN